MGLELKSLNKDSKDVNKVSDLLYEAFPEVERLPLELLFDKANLDEVDFLAIYDEDNFIGFTYLITRKNLTYVQYLAIDSHSRSKGYGSLILSRIKEKYFDNQLTLNIETLDKSATNYEQRVNRKNFYLRNGYESSGLLFKDRWGMYEVMVNGGGKVNQKEFTDLIRGFTGNSLFLYLEIQIQLA
jgi:GNAT superfamily N-acetyltransferase